MNNIFNIEDENYNDSKYSKIYSGSNIYYKISLNNPFNFDDKEVDKFIENSKSLNYGKYIYI